MKAVILRNMMQHHHGGDHGGHGPSQAWQLLAMVLSALILAVGHVVAAWMEH